MAWDISDPVVADILQVATAEFAQYGYGGARLERIIALTSTSRRMIYYHFGSKEGLYQAVLEHAFEATRHEEQAFDPSTGSPMEALRRFAELAFDSLSARPDFVRLLTFENLSGARHIQGSELISRINQRGLANLKTILTRGQQAGVMRQDITALDIFMNLVGLSYYHVANKAGYVAGGFAGDVQSMLSDTDFQSHRRAMIVESTLRLALYLPPA